MPSVLSVRIGVVRVSKTKAKTNDRTETKVPKTTPTTTNDDDKSYVEENNRQRPDILRQKNKTCLGLFWRV